MTLYIEMRPALLHSPRVRKMACWLCCQSEFIEYATPGVVTTIGLDAASRIVIVGLMNVWSTARQIAREGFIDQGTIEQIDQIAGIPLFGEAMRQVGWLVADITGILLPNFLDHNPSTMVDKGGKKATVKESECAWKYSEDFLRFWAAYPKKAGKGAAWQVWQRLKPSQRAIETIICAIEIHKRSLQWTKSHGQFIPHPATWLNQHRWEDTPDHVCEDAVERAKRTIQKSKERREQSEKDKADNARKIREVLDRTFPNSKTLFDEPESIN